MLVGGQPLGSFDRHGLCDASVVAEVRQESQAAPAIFDMVLRQRWDLLEHPMWIWGYWPLGGVRLGIRPVDIPHVHPTPEARLQAVKEQHMFDNSVSPAKNAYLTIWNSIQL